MHPQQKAAWFILIVFAAMVALYSTAVPILSWRLHRPWTSVAVPMMGVFGLCGLWGFAQVFYRRRRDGKPPLDERDHLLALRAWRAGMVAFWLVFVFGCVGLWGFMRYVCGIERVNLPVEVFPGMVFIALIILTVTQALATLHYYGWRWNDAADK